MTRGVWGVGRSGIRRTSRHRVAEWDGAARCVCVCQCKAQV